MAHFAKLDDNNVVLAVHVVNNSELLDAEGNESEARGVEFLVSLYGGGNWKQTSYNGNFRKHYASVGFVYHADIDAFVPPKPYASWVLNESEARWEAPVPYPDDGQLYDWDEDTTSWQLYVEPAGNTD